MDPWKELAAIEECRDAVRAWSEFEGERPQAADELLSRYHVPSIGRRNWQLAMGLGVKIAAWAYDVWWHITRR